jgi:Fe-S-cluster-containing hydrogenase component 2
MTKEHTINPRKARIHIATTYPGILDQPVVCRQCKEHPCVSACPVKALSVNKVTEAIMLDVNTCIGCEQCVSACPYAAVSIQYRDGNKKAAICDLCNGDPECVKWCPFSAIELSS